MKYKTKKGFQVGDKLRPRPGYTQSLYWRLSKLEEVEVTVVPKDYSARMVVRCTKGQTSNKNSFGERYDMKLAKSFYTFSIDKEKDFSAHWSQSGFIVSEEHFELININIDDYGLF